MPCSKPGQACQGLCSAVPIKCGGRHVEQTSADAPRPAQHSVPAGAAAVLSRSGSLLRASPSSPDCATCRRSCCQLRCAPRGPQGGACTGSRSTQEGPQSAGGREAALLPPGPPRCSTPWGPLRLHQTPAGGGRARYVRGWGAAVVPPGAPSPSKLSRTPRLHLYLQAGTPAPPKLEQSSAGGLALCQAMDPLGGKPLCCIRTGALACGRRRAGGCRRQRPRRTSAGKQVQASAPLRGLHAQPTPPSASNARQNKPWRGHARQAGAVPSAIHDDIINCARRHHGGAGRRATAGAKQPSWALRTGCRRLICAAQLRRLMPGFDNESIACACVCVFFCITGRCIGAAHCGIALHGTAAYLAVDEVHRRVTHCDNTRESVLSRRGRLSECA